MLENPTQTDVVTPVPARIKQSPVRRRVAALAVAAVVLVAAASAVVAAVNYSRAGDNAAIATAWQRYAARADVLVDRRTREADARAAVIQRLTKRVAALRRARKTDAAELRRVETRVRQLAAQAAEGRDCDALVR